MSLIPRGLTEQEEQDYRLLREHHDAIREHDGAKARVNTLASRLAEAEDDSAVAAQERRDAKSALQTILR